MQKDDVLRLLRDPNLIPSEKQTLLSDIAAQAVSLGFPCYVVGGFVRDLLLGKPVKDLDVIVEGDAIKLGKPGALPTVTLRPPLKTTCAAATSPSMPWRFVWTESTSANCLIR
jgi:hypothetical protein